MFEHLQRLLDDTARLIAAGQVDAAAARCDFPLPLHLDGHLRLVPDAAALGALLSATRARHGAPEARLVAVELPRNGRFRLWLALWAAGGAATGTDLVCYCREDRGGLRLEMVDVLRADAGARAEPAAQGSNR